MAPSDLLKIYERVLRPSAEYSSVIYNTLIPSYISDKLELVQRQAMKIIFGHGTDCNKLYSEGVIETLKSRREKRTLSFALKAAASPRYGPLWFKETPHTEREVRQTTRLMYIENRCRTELGRNNQISYMTRQLNGHYSG